MHHWWKVTTSPIALELSVSRRFRRKVFLQLLVVTICIMAALIPERANLRMCLLCVGVVLYSRCPITSVWPDMLLGVSASLVFLLGHSQCDFPGSITVLLFTLLMSFFGVYSLSILLYAASAAIRILAGGLCNGPIDVITMCSVLVGCTSCFFDFRTALLNVRVYEKNTALAKLLDYVTDGFCSVECRTGIIQSCSPRLEETFLNQDVQGMSFSEFVHDSDVGAVQQLFVAKPAGVERKPILVTCRAVARHAMPDSVDPEPASFDAKVIPADMADHSIILCLLVQGERRSSPYQLNAPSGMENINEEASSWAPQQQEATHYPLLPLTDTELQGKVSESTSPCRRRPDGRRRSRPEALKSDGSASSLVFSVTQHSGSPVGSPVQLRRPLLNTGNASDVGTQTDAMAAFSFVASASASASSATSTPLRTESEPLTQDRGTETSIVWARDGFVCRRCARPPKAPMPHKQAPLGMFPSSSARTSPNVPPSRPSSVPPPQILGTPEPRARSAGPRRPHRQRLGHDISMGADTAEQREAQIDH